MSETIERTSFDEAVLALRATSASELVAALNALFLNITSMKAEEVEAAYRTIRTVQQAVGSTENCFAKELKAALLSRMYVLVGDKASFLNATGSLTDNEYRSKANDLLRRFRGLTSDFRYDLSY
jgi:hypothetical protein